MWRGNRDAEGWKIKENDDSSLASAHSLTSLDVTRAGAHGLDLDRDATYLPSENDDEDEAAVDCRVDHLLGRERRYAPESGMTPIVPRLVRDVGALRRLAASDLPPLRVATPAEVVQVFYGFGDAAGKGFGATVAGSYHCSRKLSEPRAGPKELRYRVGIWTAEEEEESSNFKELCNLVETAEKEAEAGRLRNCEFFLFTDNLVAESCYYCGSSSSPKLHSLVLLLRVLEMRFGMRVLVVNMSHDNGCYARVRTVVRVHF